MLEFMNKPMLNIVKEKLAANGVNLVEISTITGVPLTTVKRIKTGYTPNPGVLQVQALYDYFNQRHTTRK